MKIWKRVLAAAFLAVAGISGAQAASVTCGNGALGVRVTTVDPALTGGLCYAGLQNLGDGALVTLLNSLITPDEASLINRDTANSNGGALSITGVGLLTGSWSFDADLWNSFDRMFLYFHFGDGNDCKALDCTGFATDPDIFIVELVNPVGSGTWKFEGVGAKLNGLSNIALLGVVGEACVPTPENGNCGQQQVPEPGALALVALGLVGVGAMSRRRRSV